MFVTPKPGCAVVIAERAEEHFLSGTQQQAGPGAASVSSAPLKPLALPPHGQQRTLRLRESVRLVKRQVHEGYNEYFRV